MVLESVIKPIMAIRSPWKLFFYGFVVTSLAVFLSYWIFKDRADLVMIFLTVFALVPLMFNAMKEEEEYEISDHSEKSILKRHAKVIAFYTFLFVGVCAAFVLWYVALPVEMSSALFKQQISTISEINAPIQGHLTSLGHFNRIILNNIKVLIFSIIFAFLYGAGAIFILVWNASVVSAAIGHLVKVGVAKYAASGGIVKFAAVSQSVAYSTGRYFIHGLPEMMAYMIGGVAGGVISVAVINRHFGTDRSQKIMFDSSVLMLIAVGVLLIAALIESFITPVLF